MDDHSQTTLPRSFQHACRGLLIVLRGERNMQIHLVRALSVSLAGVILGVSDFESIILVACIAIVLFAELINTGVSTR